MRKQVLLMTFCGLLLSNYVFAEKVAIRDATVDRSQREILITTINNEKYILTNLNDVKVLIDSKLDGTYADVKIVRNDKGGRNLTSDGKAEFVGKITIYVRDVYVANKWHFALGLAKFPQDVFPSIK